MMTRPAVFLDRDGTIIVNKPYLYRPEDLEFLPGAIEAIRLLNDNDYLVIVVTNQSGVARDYFSEADVITLHDYLNHQLRAEHAHIDQFYFCPHHYLEGMGRYKKHCTCRKPNIGMIEQAIKEFQIDRSRSFLIGDQISDLQAGLRAGLKRSLLVTPKASLLHIVQWIINQ